MPFCPAERNQHVPSCVVRTCAPLAVLAAAPCTHLPRTLEPWPLIVSRPCLPQAFRALQKASLRPARVCLPRHSPDTRCWVSPRHTSISGGVQTCARCGASQAPQWWQGCQARASACFRGAQHGHLAGHRVLQRPKCAMVPPTCRLPPALRRGGAHLRSKSAAASPCCCLPDQPTQYDPAAVAGQWSLAPSPSPPPRQQTAAEPALRPALSLTLLCPVFAKTGSCGKGELCKMVSRWGCVDAAWQLSASAPWQLHGLQQHAKARHACTAR